MIRIGRLIALTATSGALLALTACGGTGSTQTPLSVTQKLAEAKVPCENQESDRIPSLSESVPSLDVLRCSTTGGEYGFLLWADTEGSDQVVDAVCRQLLLVKYFPGEIYSSDLGLAGYITRGANWVAITETGSIVRSEDLAAALSGEVQTFPQLCGTYAEELLASAAETEAKEAEAAAAQQRESELLAIAASQAEQARDLNATPETLRALARTQEFQVAVAIALNPNAPGDVLEALASRDFTVKLGNPAALSWAIAKNPNTPVAILQKLSQSSDAPTRTEAQKALAGSTAGN